ncbi:MAG: ArnT family glycosyltransferase [Candidatus Micrarchaeia archaeon]
MDIVGWIYGQFQTPQVQSAYFYYYMALISAFALSIVLSNAEIRELVSRISMKSYLKLAIILLAFLIIELAFVKPTHLLYNDEYIYTSIAKMMLTEHLAAVCSFSNSTSCVPGTAGFIHQPLGWSFLLSIPSAVMEVNFAVAYTMEVIFAMLAVVFLFYTTYMLLENENIALLSGAILAFTPLFMRYAMSSVLDIPALAFLLISSFLLFGYMKTKSLKIGIATILSIAYMLSIKVDMVFAIAVMLAIILFDRNSFEGEGARRDLRNFLLLFAICAIISIPDILYVVAATQVSFGAPTGQPNFGLKYFEGNFVPNVLFWFGRYDSVYISEFNSYYYDEFPLTFTALAIVGSAILLLRKKYRELAIIVSWFLIVFMFYTTYYAGSVNYGVGDDVRYFLSAFPPIAIAASYGFMSIFDYLGSKHGARKGKKRILQIVLLVALFVEPFWLFANYVTIPPLHLYPFAAERYDEALIMANYQQIPTNCYVLTFKPPLWYILNRGNMYAGWISNSSDLSKLLNMSKGCLYFDYSISCYINWTGPPNTQQQCNQVMKTFNMYPIAETHLDNYSWNVSLYLYKITGLNKTSS